MLEIEVEEHAEKCQACCRRVSVSYFANGHASVSPASPDFTSAGSDYLSQLRRDSVGADFQSVRKLTNPQGATSLEYWIRERIETVKRSFVIPHESLQSINQNVFGAPPQVVRRSNSARRSCSTLWPAMGSLQQGNAVPVRR